MAFHFMKFTPSPWLMFHDITIRDQGSRNVIGVKNLTPYLPVSNVHGYEVLCGLLTLFEGYLVSNMQDIMVPLRLLRVIRISNCSFINISSLIFYIAFLALYVALCMCHYIHHGTMFSRLRIQVKRLKLRFSFDDMIFMIKAWNTTRMTNLMMTTFTSYKYSSMTSD